MTKLKLTLLDAISTLSLTNPASSFAADARIIHICSRKLRLVLRVRLLVWAAGSAGVLGSAETLAQNAYITNQFANTVSVIDTARNIVTETIAVGANPVGVAVSPNGSTVYVTNYLSNTVSVIDATTNTISATIPVGTEPTDVAVSPNGSTVYVTNFTPGTVSVIDAATNAVTATIPLSIGSYALAVTPDGGKVYVANENSGTVSVIDPIQ